MLSTKSNGKSSTANVSFPQKRESICNFTADKERQIQGSQNVTQTYYYTYIYTFQLGHLLLVIDQSKPHFFGIIGYTISP